MNKGVNDKRVLPESGREVTASIFRIKNIVLGLLVVVFSQCAEKNKDTRLFSEYLQATFKREIPQSKHKFILTGGGCPGCNARTLLHAVDHAGNTQNTYIFSSEIEDKLPGIHDYTNIWLDTTCKVKVLKFHMNSACVMHTSEGKVDSVVVFDIETQDSILNSIETP